MRKHPQIVIGVLLIALFICIAITAPLLAPNDPNATNLALKNAPPSAEYPLGCDQMGRCELSRLIYGARYSLSLTVPVLIVLAAIALFTLFKTQGGFYDPGNTIGNIDPSMAMDPIISQVAAYLPGGADLITELESTTDEERIQEIYGIILTTMADQCLTTPLVYPHQLAVYSDKIANYDFPPDANFTAVQNITLK